MVDISRENYTIDKLLYWISFLLFLIFPLGTAFREITGGVLLILWFLSGRFWKNRQFWIREDWVIPVFIFMLIPLTGVLITEDQLYGLKFLKKTYYWLYAFAIASIALKGYPHKKFLDAFIIGFSINVFLSLLQYFGLFPMHKEIIDEFPTGTMGHIDYTLFLVFGMLLLSYNFKETKDRNRKLFIILMMTLYLFSLTINIGRSGYLAFILLCPWIFYNLFSGKHLTKIIIASVVVIALLLTSNVVQSRIQSGLNDIRAYFQGNIKTSIGMRLYMWEGSINIFLENPLLGVGTGGFTKALKEFKDDPEIPGFVHPHNSFLYIMATHGIVGLVSFLWLLWVYFKKGWKSRYNRIGFAILAYGIVFLIGSMTDTEIRSHSALIMMVLLMGIRVDSDNSLTNNSTEIKD